MNRIRSVVLVQTPCYELNDDRLEPPLGLLYLATWLNQHHYSTQIVDLASVQPECWADRIPWADVYGFSTYTTTYHRTLQVLQVARQINPSAWMVAGGPHASALPQQVSADFDFVIVGEGEMALLELLQSLDRGETAPRIGYGLPVADLDSLPFPDYSLVDVPSYRREVAGRPSLSILSSRGCPFGCVFCNSIVMGGHQRVRFRSAAHVINEIRQLETRLNINSFRFQDDLFTFNLVRLRELAALLRAEQVTYRSFGRVDQCSQEVTDLLYNSGCRHIALGVESGSGIMLERMAKGQTVNDIRQGIAHARSSGMIVRVYLIVGFPGETWDTVRDTVELMLECKPDEFVVYPLIPYPGTPLYHRPERFGITAINPDFSQYFQVQAGRRTGYVFRTRDLDENRIAEMREWVIEQLEPTITWAGESRGFK